MKSGKNIQDNSIVNKDFFILTKEDSIAFLAEKCPRAIELLTEYGLSCANCFLRQFETVEMGAQVHGMNDEEINKMVDEINEILRKEAE